MTYVDTARKKKNGKVYERHLLRKAYRENGKIKRVTIANISSCSPEEIFAIKLALKHKHDLSALCSVKDSVSLSLGKSIGAVWVLYQVAKRLGIEQAIGSDRDGRLALWQVISRVINQSSRLGAVRLAGEHACCEVLGLDDFNEDSLYRNLDWLCEHQFSIEKRLFDYRSIDKKTELFLYDVTSSYLEGDKNELSDWGYNRDKKSGKKQIVIGLLCDDGGVPVSVGVFPGNTSDLSTLGTQVHKVSEMFGCSKVTMVGDRGMIKSAQVATIKDAGFHYITAISKAEIESLIKCGVIQLDLFDDKLVEVEDKGIRYVLRRNPKRAEEISDNRLDKRSSIERLVEMKNEYLSEHPKASVEIALRDVNARIEKLFVSNWIKVFSKDRELYMEIDKVALARESRFDGCYVLKTDLSREKASKEIIHDRYKDLAQVEDAFRTMKTAHLEVRPVHLRLAARTRAHVFIVMLAYMLTQELKKCWKNLNITVEEGIANLSMVCGTDVLINAVPCCQKIPEPKSIVKKLFDSARVLIPEVLPNMKSNVTTKKKLEKRRLNH
jgi:transposase